MDKKRILANLEKALVYVSHHPDERLSLDSFIGHSDDCGTLYCTMGLLTTKKFFQKQGLEIDDRDFVRVRDPECALPQNADSPSTNKMFGPLAYDRLFAIRYHGIWDGSILAGKDRDISDKDLAMKRLRRQIKFVNEEMA